MPEIEDNVEFKLECDCLRFITTANCDKLILEHINLDAPTTASLAWLANQPSHTMLTMKIELTPQE